MDIMEVNGKPFAKRGKWSGSKRVLRCLKCSSPKVAPFSKKPLKCTCGGKLEDVLLPFTDKKKILLKLLPAESIRSFVLGQIENLSV
jgi:nicotinate phosphoribosyltransferase